MNIIDERVMKDRKSCFTEPSKISDLEADRVNELFNKSYKGMVLQRMMIELCEKGWKYDYDFEHSSTLIGLYDNNCSERRACFLVTITLVDFRTVRFKLSFPFIAEYDTIFSVMRYTAEYNREKEDFPQLNCDPDTGEIYLAYKCLIDYPVSFDNDDFCFFVSKIIEAALNTCDELCALTQK